MTDFFSRLAARQLGEATGVSPRLASRFEPQARVVPTPDIADRRVEAAGHDERAQAAPVRRTSLAVLRDASPPESTTVTRRRPSRHVVAPPAASRFAGEAPMDRSRAVSRPAEARSTVSSAKPRPDVVRADPVSASVPSAMPERISAQTPPPAHHRSADRTDRRGPPTVFMPAVFEPRHVVPRDRSQGPTRSAADGPVVHVTIGRLEVHAAGSPDRVPARRADATPKTMSLDEYLERRHGARR
jgi:hypothetical protein